mgnify:CR=1 FL=1
MSFFSKLAFIAGELDLQITFKKKGDKITVGVFPSHSNKELSEKIKPITLTGTAAELDEGFFEHLSPGLEKVAGIISNIETVDAELKKLEEQKKGKAAGTKAKENDPKAKKAADKKQPSKKETSDSDEDKDEGNESEVEEPKEVQQSIFE